MLNLIDLTDSKPVTFHLFIKLTYIMIVNENGYEWVGRFIHRSIFVVQKKTNGV